jgi:hypothetical protein
MSSSKIITTLGFAMLMLYIILQILNFYGIGQDVYGIYLVFFLFLITNTLVLPTKYSEI